MTNKEPMLCPHCGAVMNHHADKVDYSVEEPEDEVFGGVLEEVHVCPNCGRIELQRARN